MALCLHVVLLTACFEEPVEERLHLEMRGDGTYEVTETTAISNAVSEEKNQALARRLAETRRSFEQGIDPWTARFALLEPGAERITWEREDRVLVRVQRTALGGDHEALRRFMADANLSTFLTASDGEMALEIVPVGGGRATRSQRQRVEQLVIAWSESVAQVLAATERLYSHLEANPDRARPCLAGLFYDALGAPERNERDQENGDEQALVGEVVEARRVVLEVLEAPEDEAYTLNELSHLVYDPFPARFSVSVPGTPLEVEGFDRAADGSLAVTGLGLFEALEALAGKWAQPDPVVAYVRAMRASKDSRPSLTSLTEMGRYCVAASPDEVRAALEERLRPAPRYRVVFPLVGAEAAAVSP